MSHPLERIINLIKLTGDSCIIVDTAGKPLYVVSSFERYHQNARAPFEVYDLSEDELLEKINREVALWKEHQQEKNLDHWEKLDETVASTKDDLLDAQKDKNSLNEDKNNQSADSDQETYYFEPIS